MIRFILLSVLSLNVFSGDPSSDLLAAKFRTMFESSSPASVNLDDLANTEGWECRGKKLNDYYHELSVEQFYFSQILLGISGFIEGSTSTKSITTSPFDISYNGNEMESQYKRGSYFTFRFDGDYMFVEQSSTSTAPKIPAVANPAREATAYFVCTLKS